MWSRRVIERRIGISVSMNEARSIMRQAGFMEFAVNSEYFIYKKKGRIIPLTASGAPIEIVVVKAGKGLLVKSRYSTVILFDNGYLDKLTDDFVAKFEPT